MLCTAKSRFLEALLLKIHIDRSRPIDAIAIHIAPSNLAVMEMAGPLHEFAMDRCYHLLADLVWTCMKRSLRSVLREFHFAAPKHGSEPLERGEILAKSYVRCKAVANASNRFR